MINKQGMLYVSCGVPGSGKSTFLNKIKGHEEVIVSRDEIRFSLLKEGEDYFAHEQEVFRLFCNRIAENINAGKNVYADATHLTRASRQKLIQSVKRRCTPSKIVGIFFKIPLKVCLERNEFRNGLKTYVPQDKLIQKFSKFNIETDDFEVCFTVDENGEIDKIK